VREVYVVSEGHPPAGECVLGVYESREAALTDAYSLAVEEGLARNDFQAVGERRNDGVTYFYTDAGWGAYIVVRKYAVVPKLN
jgi:hypothetical protein